MLTSPNDRGETSGRTSSAIRALFILGIVGAVVWYGLGHESGNDTSKRIQTRGLVKSAKSDSAQMQEVQTYGDHHTNCNARARDVFDRIQQSTAKMCEYDNHHATKADVLIALNNAYSFPVRWNFHPAGFPPYMVANYPPIQTAHNAEAFLRMIVHSGQSSCVQTSKFDKVSQCSPQLEFLYKFSINFDEGGKKKPISVRASERVTVEVVGGVYKAKSFDSMADKPSTKIQQPSADLLAQSIVPIDQLSASQLQAWCREINNVRNSGMNCFASKTALMQEFRGVVGFYNMPKLVPWRGQAPAFIGYTPPSQHKFVNTDNLKMYYQIWPQSTSPRNRPVVMIGGWSAVKEDWIDSARYWSQQASTKRTMMTVDIRGAGQTGFGPTAGDYTASQIARDVSDLIKQVFPGEKVFLIGGALGGKIALQVAVDYPQLLQAVIPCATVAGGALSVFGPLRAAFIELTVTGQREQQPKPYAEAIYSPSFVAASNQWADMLQRGAKYNRPLEGILRQKNIAEQFDMSAEVGGISLPVLCMHGTHDQIDLPQSSQNLCTAIGANAQYEPLTNEGHAFWQMDPTEFVIDAETFFSAKGL